MLTHNWRARHPRASTGEACVAAAGIQRKTPPKATKLFSISVLQPKDYGRLWRILTLDLRRRDAPRGAHESKMTSRFLCGLVLFHAAGSGRKAARPVGRSHKS
jgi:hypothetical protein